jgi:hypothetical protein
MSSAFANGRSRFANRRCFELCFPLALVVSAILAASTTIAWRGFASGALPESVTWSTFSSWLPERRGRHKPPLEVAPPPPPYLALNAEDLDLFPTRRFNASAILSLRRQTAEMFLRFETTDFTPGSITFLVGPLRSRFGHSGCTDSCAGCDSTEGRPCRRLLWRPPLPTTRLRTFTSSDIGHLDVHDCRELVTRAQRGIAHVLFRHVSSRTILTRFLLGGCPGWSGLAGNGSSASHADRSPRGGSYRATSRAHLVAPGWRVK